MSPKRQIRPRKLHKKRRILSSKRVAKRKLKRGLLEKTKRRESAPNPSRSRRAPPPSIRNHATNASGMPIPHSPARGPGKPTRFDKTEEEFLSNVPEQLKQYAFRPGHAKTPGSGRPKDAISLTSRLRGLLATPIDGRAHPKGKARVTYADELMSLALQAARRGDYRFFEHIYSRVEGKIPDHVVIEEVQQMVAQESEKLTAELVKIVSGIAETEFGAKRAQVFTEKLATQITEKMGAKDAGRRAS